MFCFKVKCIRDQIGYYAEKLHESMKVRLIGLGYGVQELLKNMFNLVCPSLSPPLFPPPSPFPSFVFSHPLLPPSLSQGLGTDEDTLTRVIVMRSEIDLVQVMGKYREEYNETLGQAIKVH